MAEGVITLPPDSTGKSLRTVTGGGIMPANTHQEVHTLALPDGSMVAPGQSSLPVTGPLTDTQLRATTVPVSGTLALDATALEALDHRRQKTHVEFIPTSAAPTTIYKGYAPVGTADSAAAWTIQRFVFTANTAIDETWSSTTAVWADRATTVVYT